MVNIYSVWTTLVSKYECAHQADAEVTLKKNREVVHMKGHQHLTLSGPDEGQ